MKLPHTEVKFYPEVKSQTGLSSLRVSCKRALKELFIISIASAPFSIDWLANFWFDWLVEIEHKHKMI